MKEEQNAKTCTASIRKLLHLYKLGSLWDVLLKEGQSGSRAVSRTKLHFRALISHPYLYLMTSKQLIPRTVCYRFMYQLYELTPQRGSDNSKLLLLDVHNDSLKECVSLCVCVCVLEFKIKSNSEPEIKVRAG